MTAPTPLPNPFTGDHGVVEDSLRDTTSYLGSHTHAIPTESMQDTVAAMLLAGSNVTLTYNDTAGTLTIDSTGGSGGGVSSDIYPEDYGALTTNSAAANTAPLQAFLNAITNGKTGRLLHGKVYQHNAALIVGTVSNGGRLVGPGELRATVPSACNFSIQAHKFTVEDVKFTCANVTVRGDGSRGYEKFVLDGCDGAILDNVTVDGSPATGFFAVGATNYLVRDYTAMNTKADGMHNTNGCTGGRFRNTRSINCGDDGFAVVSYGSNPVICSDIQVDGHTTVNGGSRGLAVVGGSNVHYRNAQVHGCQGAGAYIASEQSFGSYGCDDVSMSYLKINRANLSSTDHGSLMFFSSSTGRILTKCAFDYVTADRLVRTAGTSPSGWLRHVVSGTPGTSSELSFNNVHLRGAGPTLDIQGNMPTGQWEATNITRQATW